MKTTMTNNNKNRLKPIVLTDQEAIKLIHYRANRECRSLANTVAITVREQLSNILSSQQTQNTDFQQSGNVS